MISQREDQAGLHGFEASLLFWNFYLFGNETWKHAYGVLTCAASTTDVCEPRNDVFSFVRSFVLTGLDWIGLDWDDSSISRKTKRMGRA